MSATLGRLPAAPPAAAGVLRLALGLARLPLSLAAAGFQAMASTLAALAPPPGAAPSDAPRPRLAAGAPRPLPPSYELELPTPVGKRSTQFVNTPPTEEESRMSSCNCCGSDYCSHETQVVCPPVDGDRGLGGRCCVKVVQYTIILARSGINDNNRIIVDPTTIAFSDDMTDADFTAWIISENCKEIDSKVAPGDRKYLRVAYQVFARFVEEERNLCEEQVAALWDIARKLPMPESDSNKPARAKSS